MPRSCLDSKISVAAAALTEPPSAFVTSPATVPHSSSALGFFGFFFKCSASAGAQVCDLLLEAGRSARVASGLPCPVGDTA